MIPRIIPTDKRRGNRENSSAFEGGAKARQLRIVIDSDGVTSQDAMLTLTGLAANPSVALLALESKAVILDAASATIDLGPSHRAFYPSAPHNLKVLASWGISSDWLAQPGIAQRLTLAMWCQTETCDAFVTESSEMLQVIRRHYPLSNPMMPDDALAAIGLLLRLREDYVYHEMERFRVTTSAKGFYELMGLGLMPKFRKWQVQCPYNDDPLEASAGALANAILRRTSRALRARDKVLGCVFRTPSESNIDEALFYFDAFLMSLAGALDAHARIAGLAYGVPTSVRYSWRETRFRERLIAAMHDRTEFLADGASFRDIVDIIFLLRNTLHEQPLIPIAVFDDDVSIVRYEIAFPSADKQRILSACERLGGLSDWGVDNDVSGGICFDLYAFVEKSMQLAINQLCSLLSLIDVSKFGCPVEVEDDPELAIAITSILKLAGLNPAK